MGLVADASVRSAFASVAFNGPSWARIRVGEAGIARSVDCLLTEGTFEDGGVVASLSPAVHVERLLEDDGN